MNKNLLFSMVILLLAPQLITANSLIDRAHFKQEVNKDSLRLVELEVFWKNLSRTVKEGDFEGYGATYHEDAVVIFATGENKTSVSLSKALQGWKQGFDNTKAGKQKDNVKFRFSQRIGDANTAHETGIFWFTSKGSDGEVKADQLVHFEMLLIKRDNKWIGMMEYQKSMATREEWEALE